MANKTNKTESPAYQIVRIVWQEANGTRGHSWLRYNHALSDAVTLGVRGGLRFDVEDFRRFLSEFRGGYWFGESGLEDWYQLAVTLDNLPACKAIEKVWGMEPFVINGRRLYPGNPRYQGDGRKPCHLYEYTECEEHRGFYVTSLTPDYVNLCRYQNEHWTWQNKPYRRMKLNREQVAEINRAAKDEKKNISVKLLNGEIAAAREVKTVKAKYLRRHAKLVEVVGGWRCLVKDHGYRGRADWRELSQAEADQGGVCGEAIAEIFGAAPQP